jgi:hypothetical protein
LKTNRQHSGQKKKSGRWFSLGTKLSSTNKTVCRDITEILLKVALNTINQSKFHKSLWDREPKDLNRIAKNRLKFAMSWKNDMWKVLFYKVGGMDGWKVLFYKVVCMDGSFSIFLHCLYVKEHLYNL